MNKIGLKLVKLLKSRKFKISAVSTLAALILIFTLILPPIMRSQAEEQLGKFLKRQVTVESIYFNPLALSLTINKLVIKEKDSIFVGFDKFYINLEIWSIVKQGLIVKEVALTNPRVNVTRNTDLSYNFSDLLNQPKTEEQPADTTSKSKFNFSINNISITGGNISFADLPKNKTHHIDNLTLTMPFISNFDYLVEVYSQPYFAALINQVPLELKGKTKPFDKTRESVIDLNLADINLTEYLEYVPIALNFKLKSALFSAQTKLAYAQINGKPSINLSGALNVKKLLVNDLRDSLLLGFNALNVGIDSIEAVTQKVRLDYISLEQPQIVAVRNKKGSINLLDALPKSEKKAEPVPSNEATQAVTPDVLVKKISLIDGKISFHDQQGRDFKTELKDINLNINNFSLDKTGDLALNINTTNQEKIALNTSFNLQSKEFTGKVSVNDIQLPLYAAYLPSELDLKTDGIFSFVTGFNLKQTEKTPWILLSDLGFELKSLKLVQKSNREEVLRVGRMAINGAQIDLQQKNIVIDSVILADNITNIKINTNGIINLNTLYRTKKNIKPVKTTTNKTETPSKQDWIALIKNIKIANNRVNFQDLSKVEPLEIRLDKINLSLKDFSNNPNTQAEMNFNMLVGKKGSIKAGGKTGIFPLNCNLNIAVDNLSITPAQVYLADKLNIALTSGNFSTKGRVIVQKKGENLLATYSGSAGVKDFVTINKESADNFLLWKDLELAKIDFNLKPFSLQIDEIKMKEMYSLLNIYKDGTTNLQQIMKKDSTKIKPEIPVVDNSIPVATTTTPKEPQNIKINKISLDNCNINFSDRRFKNTFSANMKELTGGVTGLSSEQNMAADVLVKGKYDSYAPILISGKVNPLSSNFFLDLIVSFKDIDLTQMNPYSQKYMGYVIEKGKLSLDLQYLVKDKKLDSKNNIFLDKLTLGEQVESKDATSLPVKLALAILRDTNGDINLDVPVTGSLDDPQFNIGKLVLQVLGNILTKAVVSPFSALSSLFGGGEELSFVAYTPGLATVSDAEKIKLDKIATGMQKKTNLIIEIAGYADPAADFEGLKNAILDQKIQIARVKDGLKNKTGESSSANQLSNVEYEKYLTAVYKNEPFKKETNAMGVTKKQPVPIMKKLIMDNLEVKEDDYKQLANQRALMVKDYFINEKKLDTKRVFFIQSKEYKAKNKENMPATRAEFMLKAE